MEPACGFDGLSLALNESWRWHASVWCVRPAKSEAAWYVNAKLFAPEHESGKHGFICSGPEPRTRKGIPKSFSYRGRPSHESSMQIFLKLLSFLQAPRSPFLFPCSHCLVQLAAASCQCLGDGGIRGQCAGGTQWERDHTAQWKHGAILWALMAARNFLLTCHLPTSSLSHMNARQEFWKNCQEQGSAQAS